MKKLLFVFILLVSFIFLNSCQKENKEQFTTVKSEFLNIGNIAVTIYQIKFDTVISKQKMISSIELLNEDWKSSTTKIYYLIYPNNLSETDINGDTNYTKPKLVLLWDKASIKETSLNNFNAEIIKLKSDIANRDKYINSPRYKDSVKKATEIARKEFEENDKMNNPIKYLTISKWNWNIGGFGTVGLCRFTIKNASKKTAYDIYIKVNFMGESGTVLNNETRLIAITVKPGQSKRTAEINYGFINSQSSSANCEIETASFQ